MRSLSEIIKILESTIENKQAYSDMIRSELTVKRNLPDGERYAMIAVEKFLKINLTELNSILVDLTNLEDGISE